MVDKYKIFFKIVLYNKYLVSLQKIYVWKIKEEK